MRALVVVCILSLNLLTGCSVRTYFADRGRDLADVVTVSAGTGIGVRAQIGPLALAPAIMQTDGLGLRGGEFFRVDLADENTEHPPMDGGALWWASSTFYLEDNERQHKRGKAVFALPIPENPQDMSFTIFSANVPFVSLPRTTWQAEGLTVPRYPAHYWTQIEVVLAALGSLRIGANPGELVDFLLGWLPYGDLYRDDIGRLQKRPVKARVAAPTSPKKEAAQEEAPDVKEARVAAPTIPQEEAAQEEAPDVKEARVEELPKATLPWWKRYPRNIKVFLIGEEPPLKPMTPQEIEEAKQKPESREEAARRKKAEQSSLKLRRSYRPRPGGIGL